MRRRRFAPEDVEEVRAGTNRHAHETRVGKIREPRDLTSAQFSANFSLALYLVKGGAGFKDYTESTLTDPRILELGTRIHTYVDDEIESAWQKTKPRGARVTVRLRTGESYTEYVPNLRAMTSEDVDAKFRDLATVAVPEDQAERLRCTVRMLEEVSDVSLLAPLLTRTR
jgi:2-methylcitrate dehydratase PrpD